MHGLSVNGARRSIEAQLCDLDCDLSLGHTSFDVSILATYFIFLCMLGCRSICTNYQWMHSLIACADLTAAKHAQDNQGTPRLRRVQLEVQAVILVYA